jgi:hydroxypyruvate isomerase
MPRFAANVSLLFTEHAFLERFAAAAECGFRAVEFLFPYEHAPDALAARLAAARVEPVLFNLPPGDFAKGERGLAALPGREAEFRAGLQTALDYAEALGCRRLHVMAGVPPAGSDPAACARTYRDNLAFACDQAAPHGIAVCIEPINRRDIPGYYLRDATHALAVMHQVGRTNLRLQFDVYHAQIIGGDLAANLATCLEAIGHVQIANPPGRHEPGEGEIDYAYIFALLDRLGYDGWVGCEYRPKTTTQASLAWARPWGIG